MIRRLKFILTSCLIVANMSSKAQEPLEEYLVLAAENNPGLKAAFQNYLAALEKGTQVSALPDPQLMFGYFISPVETRVGAQQFQLSASQLFPWFGTLEAQREVAVQKARVDYLAFEEARIQLFNQVENTYLDLYYLYRASQETEENLRLLESFKELARVNFEAGKSAFSNLLKVQMEEERLNSQLDRYQNQIAAQYAKFENLLNANLVNPVVFPDSLPDVQLLESREALFQEVLAQNPNLEQLQEQLLVWDKEAEAARKAGLPSFSLGFAYTNVAPRTGVEMNENGKDILMLPQVGLRIPIYRKKYESMIKEAQLKKEAVRYKREDLENQMHTQFEMLYNNYLDALENIELYRELTDLAERSLELLQSEFSTGTTDFEELLEMERNLLNYQLQLEQARVNRNTAITRLEYLSGRNRNKFRESDQQNID